MSETGSESGDQSYEIVFDGDDKKYHFVAKDGVATATYANGDVFRGTYQDGKRHGKGTYTFSNKAVYEGDYTNNKKEGLGKLSTPDGGLYEGLWSDDKRCGKGTYTYPTGDKYEGEWKDGQKHGLGTYVWTDQGCRVVGEWANGVLVRGTWTMPDGSTYTGAFKQNAPTGKGFYRLASGVSMSGTIEGKSFQPENFQKPAPDARPPEVKDVDPHTQLLRAVDKCVLKVDHFEAIYRLKRQFDGVPNFRKVEGYNVFGSGQPTVQGFKAVLDSMANYDVEKVVWVNMRCEPILYVNDMSYGPRDVNNLNENMELHGLSGAKLNELEERIMARMRAQIKSRNGSFEYYKDTFAENPADRKNMQLSEKVGDVAEDVRGVGAVYSALKDEDYQVEYHRLPIVDERSPALQDFDNLVGILRAVDAATGAYFNCQMGKGRTTTGMVVAVLMRKVLDEGKEAEPAGDEEDGAAPRKKAPANQTSGEYSVITRLVGALKEGQAVKDMVDESINLCSHMQNLRDCIHYTQEMYNKETEERRVFWKRMSVNFVERYFFLVLFAAYLKEAAGSDFSVSFEKWVQDHPELVSILGTRESGGLSTFHWD